MLRSTPDDYCQLREEKEVTRASYFVGLGAAVVVVVLGLVGRRWSSVFEIYSPVTGSLIFEDLPERLWVNDHQRCAQRIKGRQKAGLT